MRVPLSWLKEFIDVKASAEEVAEIFTMGGIEVEEVFDPYEELGELVTVKVLEVSFPEELKELALCKVTDGKEEFTLLTTAKDQVSPGLVLGAVKPGSMVFSGEKVEEKVVKGFKSYGMFLSPYEAGLGLEKDKLLSFPPDTPLGVSIYEVLKVSEPVLELAITPNRGDALSILGAARELYALTKWELREPTFEEKEGFEIDEVVKIEDEDGCFRYTGRLLKGIEVKESPFYIQKRLWLCGQRPINNVVDITNYVMLEIGQPLHAFDWETLEGRRIIVRRAKEGERLLMLDGVEREFSQEDLVIADAKRPVALAGIMGGEETGVNQDTKEVFLEAAWFNPKRIRRTSQRLKVSTDSSYRFERCVDPEGVLKGLLRACELLKKEAGAKEVSRVIDVYPCPYQPPKIYVSFERVNQYLGFELDKEEVKEFLGRVGRIKEVEDGLEFEPFSYRQDLKIPEDLIEEVARIYGYERIPTTFPVASLYAEAPLFEIKVLQKLRQILSGLGFYEVVNYSFIDPAWIKSLMLKEGDKRLKVLELANPLSVNQSVMRTSLVPGLIETARINYFREISGLKVFEVGKVFFPTEELLAEEPYRLGLLMMGYREKDEWYSEDTKFDIFDLKGVLEELFRALSLEVELRPYSEEPFLKRGLSFDLYFGDKKVGFAGEVKNLVLKAFDLKEVVFVAEVDLEALLEPLKEVWEKAEVKKPPKYPSTFRDVTCIVKRELKIGEILDYIASLEVPWLEEVKCIKIYEGPPIPEGEKSISLRFWYRAKDRTLKDEEVNQVQEELARKIFEHFGARPR
jgi:phenylalanyl-tRNA synthetase beta chain